jgi:hypothetical protein
MDRSHSLLALALPIFLALGCSGGGDDEPAVDAGVEVDAGPSYADGDWLFEEDRLLRVEIQMPSAGWDLLRFQTRNILNILGETCGEAPAPKVFTYFSATVTIEGETFSDVGVRKKGFLGSLNSDKPSLKLKMHEFVPGQTMSGLKRFTLNNSVQDPSFVNQCLGYNLFRAAGVPAPRCNFASVAVNGQELGVYVHVESVKKPFLRNHFGNDTGNLYEGTLSDFRDGWTGTFEKKTNELVDDQSDLAELSAALELDGDAMRTALEPLVDLELFMKFWAVESLVAHWDGYAGNSNNYFIYDDPATDQIAFMPWGADQLFSDIPSSIVASSSRSLLPNKLMLHDASRAEYIAAMTEVLDTVWDDDDALAEIARMENLISASVPSDQQAAFQDDLALLRTTITGREGRLRSKLAELSAGDAGGLMEPLCFTKNGGITGTFNNTWTGGGAADLTVTVDGSPLSYTQQSSFSGPSDDNPNEAIVAVFGDFADGSRTLLYVPIGLDEVAPSTITIDSGALLFYPPGSDEADRFELIGGTMTLTEGSTTAGQPVVGSFDLDIWDTPFF